MRRPLIGACLGAFLGASIGVAIALSQSEEDLGLLPVWFLAVLLGGILGVLGLAAGALAGVITDAITKLVSLRRMRSSRPEGEPQEELARLRGRQRRKLVGGGSAGIIVVLFVTGQCAGGGGSINRLEPAWSPDGKEIAFVNETESLFDQEIYVLNVENGEQRRLTENQVPEFSPAWSPDGQRIAYVRPTDFDVDFDQFDAWDIFVIHADGAREQNISRTPSSEELSAEWSPDGKKIAFDSTGIYVMSAQGTGRRRVVRGYVGDGIAWSPDGTRIAFSREYVGLFVADVDARRPRRLTRPPSPNDDDYEPAWSPEGTRIAFVRLLDGGDEEIYVMRADGSGLRNLTRNSANDASPAWSPDGTKITFASERDGNSNIYVMNADGSAQTKLT